MMFVFIGGIMEQKLKAHIRPNYKKHQGEWCVICGDRNCKSPKEHADLMEHANRYKLRSRIWCILRNDWGQNLKNGGMSTDALDKPVCYMCKLDGYEITHWSGTKKISVYKTKYIREFPNLHYYYYCSPDLYNLFESNCVEPLSQEELAKIANKNWSRFNNFVRNKVNVAFLREMKNRYIKCLVNDRQIIYRPSVKKYVPYSFYEFCISEGYKF